jgi:hypothetical protein
MTPSRPRRFTLKHAFGLSTILHVLIAPLFIVSGAVLFATGNLSPLGLSGEERLSTATLTFIQRATHLVAVAHVHERAPSPIRVARAQAKAPTLTARAEGSEVTKPTSAGGTHKSASALRPPQPALVATVPTAAPQATDAPAAVQPTTAAVVMTAAIESSHAGGDVPAGGWGQSFEHPLIADDGALSDLRAKYHFAAAITVDIDQNGRAVKIDFPPAVPADVRDEIEKRLTALRYIPAECNGLRCAAPLTVRI